MRAIAKVVACCAGAVLVLVQPGFAAEEPWQAEFEQACSKTQDAMALSTEELRALVASCDALKPKIAALDDSRAKVYGKRLQLCRDLYDFVLQSREQR